MYMVWCYVGPAYYISWSLVCSEVKQALGALHFSPLFAESFCPQTSNLQTAPPNQMSQPQTAHNYESSM